MGVYSNDNKFVIITETKTIPCNLTKKVDNSLKREINFIIKHNRFLYEHRTENEIS